MTQIYDNNAPKKATNRSINSDLLAKAKLLNINLSATLERALDQKLRQAERDLWKSENKEAIEALNELAEKQGLFSDSFREF
jgi:antitoxin CcdA